jgi:hypothetical protein
MADDQMKLFVDLSAILTGIDGTMLAPPLAPVEVDVKTVYFSMAQTKDGAVFGDLLVLYGQNQTKPPAEIADLLLNQSGDDIKYLCRSIMLMWYLGSWYEPKDLEAAAKAAAAGKPLPFLSSIVVSADAYTQGWTWSVAQAHPMGYSTFNFGYWSTNPPSLTDFIGTGAAQ